MPFIECPSPSKVRFSTEIPVQTAILPTEGQVEEEPNSIMLSGKLLPAWMVVAGVELEGMPSPSPIRCVLEGRTHVELMMMVPAGSSTKAGGTAVPFHSIVPAGHVSAGEPLIPRASITAPVAGYWYDRVPERMP